MSTRKHQSGRVVAIVGLSLAAGAVIASPAVAQNPQTSQVQPIQAGQAAPNKVRERPWIPPVMSIHRVEDEKELRDGIRYVVLNDGNGPDVIDGCYVGMEFNVYTSEGEFIYASRQPGAKPAGLKVTGGELETFKAWVDGMMGMKRFEARKLLIPKEQGPGPQGLGPIPGDKDLVIEFGIFVVVPHPDPIVAKIEPDGSRWMDLATGDEAGSVFDADGFGTFNINVFNDEGELMGSTTMARVNITASGNSNRYWVRHAHGMKPGGSRVVEFAEPEAYRQLRRQQQLNGALPDNKQRRWRMLIDCYSVTPPITQTPHNPADEKDIGDGVKIVDLVIGDGEVFEGDFNKWVPKIHFSSWSLADNSLVDSTHKPGREPVLYSALYPSIWKKGLTGMRKGGKRKMIVPPNIDKGQDFQPIQNDRGFIYELELLDWEGTIFQLNAEDDGGGFFDFNIEDDGGENGAGGGGGPPAAEKP